MIRAAALLSIFLTASARAQPSGAAEFWMRRYPLREYALFWTVDLAVSDGGKARARILAALEKNGGKLTHPLESFPADAGLKHQQFSYVVPKAGAEKALREFRRLGKIRGLTQREDSAPDASVEINAKLKALSDERKTGRAQLAQLPSTRAAVEEIAGHLEAALAARESSSGRVLLNISVEEIPVAKK